MHSAPDHESEPAELLPRELLAELIALARSGGADFAEVYGERTAQMGRGWRRKA